MARPRKHRLIACEVNATYFKPQGIPMRELEEIALDMDEVEAIRLADIEDLYHADAAVKMGVSRPTFGNIIKSAHKKVAIALLEGKALRISEIEESVRLGQDTRDAQLIASTKEDAHMNHRSTTNENNTMSFEGNQTEAHKSCGEGHGQDHSHDEAHECGCDGQGHGKQHHHSHGRGRCGGGGGGCGRGRSKCCCG